MSNHINCFPAQLRAWLSRQPEATWQIDHPAADHPFVQFLQEFIVAPADNERYTRRAWLVLSSAVGETGDPSIRLHVEHLLIPSPPKDEIAEYSEPDLHDYSEDFCLPAWLIWVFWRTFWSVRKQRSLSKADVLARLDEVEQKLIISLAR
ncbi:MAG: hypothetical protein IRZ03_16230 [Acidobacterium ailaaui]|nr:hypothetical protein [Pseudacidobacterium ailaaui]